MSGEGAAADIASARRGPLAAPKQAASWPAPDAGNLNHTSGNVVLMYELEPSDNGMVERLWTAR